jgi:carbonic anhydrase/acetyltransferase-like protein (isoleucine patch superfamily)
MPLYDLQEVRPEFADPRECWIAPTAVVIGRVRLERFASVWYGAVLRGDHELIRVGESSNVQDGCVLHTDDGFPLEIGSGCTIGHMAMLHGCRIGANSLIGIGSIVLNGAEIGESTLIGANTLIPEGKTIPPRVLVMGSPGRVVRPLTDIEVAGLKVSAASYVENWRRYLSGASKRPT